MLQTIISEVAEVWTWIITMVAGMGLTFSLLIAIIIILFLKVTKISSKLRNLENRVISTERDFSLQINQIKSSKERK